MPKFNVDEQTQLAEPIEITLEGKTYIVKKITTELMDKVTKILPPDTPKEKMSMDAPIKQLALLLGIDENELKDIDIRKIGKALEFITDTVTKGFDSLKNVSKAEAK